MVAATWAVADADIIMAGAGAVAITTAGAAVAATGTIVTTKPGLCHLPRTNEIGTTAKGTGRTSVRPVSFAVGLTQPHLDRDANQVGMVLRSELLLQQRRRVRNGLV